ncbi:AAA family ATPase, partial [Macrococcus epidermidis]|uniref:AAA family ATPase n=1 Tax=Macrococcus epidermidis TaxID=1902580 RepID=UPI001EF39E3D
NTSINFDKLNIITGNNSSGKSSIIEAMIILQQKNENDFLNGEILSLGDSHLLINNQSIEKRVKLKYKIGDEEVILTFDENDQEIENDKKISFDIVYLSAERTGVRDLYEQKVIGDKFDPTGNTLISLLNEYQNNSELGTYYAQQINKKLKVTPDFELKEYREIQYFYTDNFFSGKVKVLEVVNYWMECLTGYSVNIYPIERTRYIQITYSKNDNEYTPHHVGTGVTFILFQIIAGLLSKNESVILIENPEIHLHPKLQSNLMYFYLWLSSLNKQIIIETHSDHIFNACRYFKTYKEKCKIYFVKESSINQDSNPMRSSKILNIEVDDYGDLLKEYDGLFDQYIIDIRKMVAPKK